MKKITAILCAICLIFGTFACGFASVSATDDEIPFIYVVGYASRLLLDDENGVPQTVYPVDASSDMILGYVSENKEVLIKAFTTQNWSDFDDTICKIMKDIFKDIKLDNNGYPDNGSYCNDNGTEQEIKERYSAGRNNLNDYEYSYDWRLDAYDNMQNLRDYITTVQKVTGKEDYAVCGRCEGSNLLLTYMDTYKDPHLKKAIFYASSSYGTTPITELFCGDLKLEADAIERFIYSTDFGLNVDVGGMFTLTDELLRQIVTAFSNIYGLDIACWSVNNVFGQIYKDILPRAMMDTYGSFPGFWGMVGKEKYEQAKSLMFEGREEEYSNFIKKIDTFHNTIICRAEEIISDAQLRGTEVFDIVKYGIPLIPVTGDTEELSDGLCKVRNTSFGATVSNVNEPFDDAKLLSLEKAGNISYVSPEKNIDASTGLLKDTTWYIDNYNHGDFYIDADEPLINAMLNDDGFNIHTDKRFPQYLYFDTEKDVFIIPSAESTCASPVEIWKKETSTPAREFKPYFEFVYKIITFIIKLFTLPARY